MPKPTKYTATFSNGVVKTRSSHRTYRAAWYAEGTYTLDRDGYLGKKGDVRHSSNYGFSSSLAQADRNMRTEMRHLDNFTFAEARYVDEVE
jgi:hypothetical protein